MKALGNDFLGECSDAHVTLEHRHNLRLALYFTFPFASLRMDGEIGEIIYLDLPKNINGRVNSISFSSALDDTVPWPVSAINPDARSWRQARQASAPITDLHSRKRDPGGAPGMSGSFSSSQPVRADWLSAGLVDQICRR